MESFNSKNLDKSFDKLWINARIWETVLDNMRAWNISIDPKIIEIQNYFECLIKNKLCEKWDIIDSLNKNSENRKNIVRFIYSIPQDFLIDQISVNLWEEYLSWVSDKVSISNIDTWESIILDNIVYERCTNLHQLHMMIFTSDKEKITISNQIEKKVVMNQLRQLH